MVRTQRPGKRQDGRKERGMAKKIFERVEKKYLLTASQYQALRQGLEGSIKPDIYEKYTIGNIYFDTDNYDLIRASLDKPLYKEKLRLRSYGVPRMEDTVYVEIKKKFQGVVYKRRVDMTLAEAQLCLYQGQPHLEGGADRKGVGLFSASIYTASKGVSGVRQIGIHGYRGRGIAYYL